MPEINLTLLTSPITAIVANFIIDRQARGLSPNTIRYYQDELGVFNRWLDDQRIIQIDQVTPEILRTYFIDLAKRRNKGGVHSVFRSVKACLNWLEKEEDGDYKNPISKIEIPSVKSKARPGISLKNIQLMINACIGPLGQRDQTILRALLDTGARAFEFVALNLEDINLSTGAVIILHGKGDKERTVYVGSITRRSLKRYLKTRTQLKLTTPLWVTDEDERLSKRGLKAIIERRARDAKIPIPGLHDFRRAFALTMWRNHIDILTISRLMGHSSIEVTRRYIEKFDEDLRIGHAKGSPVDNAML